MDGRYGNKFMGMVKQFFRAWKDVKAFKELPASARRIVFYAEDNYSMAHFEEMLECLTHQHDQAVCYLTSSPDDPILSSDNPNIHAFYVSSGTVRTALFIDLWVDLLVLTMPDLETFHIKRSKAYPVHYLYVFHAMVSTHLVYRKAAFDHFDTIFLTGPFQRDEIRSTESVYGLQEKTLVDVGYPRLDALRRDFLTWRKAQSPGVTKGPLRVIVAPSWGKTAVLETCGEELVSILLDAGYHVTVRPHPMTTKQTPQVLDALWKEWGSHERFAMETDVRDKTTLYGSDVMISDWSGVALEYAFGCEKPVIFIDVPKKKNNPEAERITEIPVEVSIRQRVGRVVSPDRLQEVPEAINRIVADQASFLGEIKAARDECVFNLDQSATVGARYIKELAHQLHKQNASDRSA